MAWPGETVELVSATMADYMRSTPQGDIVVGPTLARGLLFEASARGQSTQR